MEYYFLGGESNLRVENRYHDLDQAISKAAYIASKRLVPIRIFKMWPNKQYSHARTVTPKEALEILKNYEEFKEFID